MHPSRALSFKLQTNIPRRPSSIHLRRWPGASRLRAKELSDILNSGGFEPDPAYIEGGEFLRDLGMTNQAEISRILDIAMNPNSLFLSPKERRMTTASARRLSVEADMKPVVEYLRGVGLEDNQIIKMIEMVPCLLCYSPEERIRPVLEYLQSIGIHNPAQIVAKRPSLLGLDVDQNLKKIVGYLLENEYKMDSIIKWLETSI